MYRRSIIDTYLVIRLDQYFFEILTEVQEMLKATKKLMNPYRDKYIFLKAVECIYLIIETFFGNLIKTSKNKDHFILKKSQRTVDVVLNFFEN